MSHLPLSKPLRYLCFFILCISVVNYCDGEIWAHISLASCKGRWFKAKKFLIFIEQHLKAQ